MRRARAGSILATKRPTPRLSHPNPNSQVYIIPYPTNQPSLWEAKLFITPGRSITLTGVALLATCFLVGLIIVMLHAKEKRQDRKEMMQDARRFHFDAM